MFQFSCPLRWGDLDAQGHVNNAVVVDYLQEARVAFLRSGPATALLDTGIVVVGHQVEYHRPIDYIPDSVTIELGVSQLGGSRIEIAYAIRQGGEVAALARTVLCPFDFDEQRPVRLSPQDREFFDGHRIEVEKLRPIPAPDLRGRGLAVPIHVCWSDLDAYGHVNNATFFDYVQQARVAATTLWDPEMARAGSPGSDRLWLVVRQDVDFVSQLSHRIEAYEARVAPVKLGGSSMKLSTELVNPDDGTLYARGRTVLVSAGLDGRPLDLGDRTRELLEPHLVG